MTKENKIELLLAFLAPIINENEDETDAPVPQVSFLSAREVQIDYCPGEELPTNKEFQDNPLVDMFYGLVDNWIRDEHRHWLESIGEDDEDFDEDDFDGKYNPNLCPDHTYHAIRTLALLIDYEVPA